MIKNKSGTNSSIQKVAGKTMPPGKAEFKKAVETLRKEKDQLYTRMKSQANDPETIRHYAESANNFSDVDTDML
jgi:hypothetical protein